MIEEPRALTIRRPSRRPSQAQIDAFRGVPTGIVVDAMDGRGAMAAAIAPLGPGAPAQMCGPALTADNGPGDVLATFGALALARPGDVLVAGFGGHQSCAAAGDRIMGMLRNAGGAGFVTDGPMRDLAGIAAVGLPVWCTGLNPGSPFASGPGRVGLPVQVGGQMVDAGDMIVGDADGVVVVPWAEIDAVAARLPRIQELEAALDAEVAAGRHAPQMVLDLLAGPVVRYVD